MAVYNYAEQFTRILAQKYATELCSHELTLSNPGVTFINAQTIKLPRLTVSGYKNHTRTPGFNAGTLANDWEPKKLEHDRDIEFFVDPMDIDETNLALSVANIQNTFEEEQAIPEKDSYRFSKILSEYKKYSETPDTTVLSASVFLDVFDGMMAEMDEAGVPEEGRLLFATPTTRKIIKNAEGIERNITINTASTINRKVHSIDDVAIKSVPAARMKSQYDFTDGCVAASGAKQINFIIVHPSAVICRDKYAYIKLFTPGSDSRTGDGYLYQNRNFGDLFLIERKVKGVAINMEPTTPPQASQPSGQGGTA